MELKIMSKQIIEDALKAANPSAFHEGIRRERLAEAAEHCYNVVSHLDPRNRQWVWENMRGVIELAEMYGRAGRPFCWQNSGVDRDRVQSLNSYLRGDALIDDDYVDPEDEAEYDIEEVERAMQEAFRPVILAFNPKYNDAVSMLYFRDRQYSDMIAQHERFWDASQIDEYSDYGAKIADQQREAEETAFQQLIELAEELPKRERRNFDMQYTRKHGYSSYACG
jgi:hypothetical protein